MTQRHGGTRLPFFDARPPEWQPDEPPSLDGVDTVYLDAETDGLEWHKGARPCGWAVKPKGRPSVYLPFGHRGGGNLPREQVIRWMQRELRGKRITNLALKFDANMSRADGVDLAEQGNTFHDVAHDAALLDDHRRIFTLDGLAHDFLGEKKIDLGPKDNIHERPAWEVAPYARHDVELAEQLDAHFIPLIAAEDLGRVAYLEDTVIPVVVEMEQNGVPIDEELLFAWVTQSKQALEDLSWELYRACGFTVNPDKADDMIRLFAHCGAPMPPRHAPSAKAIANLGINAVGVPSFAAEHVKAAALRFPLIAKAQKIGKLIDLRSKFLIPYAAMVHNGHLYGRFNQLKTTEGGTVSGRFSMVGFNGQQVMTPAKQMESYGDFLGHTFIIRQLFKQKQGKPWMCIDQAQVEFRMFGHYAKCKRILDAYREDPWTKFHHIVQAMIAAQQPIELKAAKNANFARVYGAGLAKFASMVGTDMAKAQKILDVYDAEFPEAKTLQRTCTRIAEQRGYLMTILGRRARFPRKERTHKGLNAVCQGSAADSNKTCTVEVYKERKRLGLTLQLTVHDELNGALDDSATLKDVLAIVNTQWIPMDVPILWDGKTGASWADCK